MMLEALAAAMQQLWMQTGLPVYADGQVPDGAAYPYITWTVDLRGAWNTHLITAACWYENDWQGCLRMLTCMQALLPGSGIVLPIGSGYGQLWCAEAAAQRTQQPGHIDCGRLSAGMRLYAAYEGGMTPC